MPVGDDDTLASSLPTLSGEHSIVPEVIAGRYQIVRWLGGGGMGRVYEVLDTELGEKVALKVLRSGLSEEAIERFRREVRLTRRIQHRNVARMFDIGEHRGDKFLTMELVDGVALTQHLSEPLPWARMKSLAMQLCAGLAAAHHTGVVHRDLKPDNILIERGTDRAVITDFGIARSGDEESVTQAGVLIGTPRYMSPEQLAGTDIDARSDLFSLGVMLFEMATGKRPWSGDNPVALAVTQVTQPPRAFVAPALPVELGTIIGRCIEIDRARRPQTADEIGSVIAACEAPSASSTRSASPTRAPASSPTPSPTGTTLSDETTLAVLPFGCAPSDEYLADGIVEELVDLLSTTPTLRVRPTGLVRSHANQDPREIGNQLGVDHVVVGTLRRTPAGLRISARLISVADGFQVWAHRVDCSEAELLTVSDQLTRAIGEALSTRVAPQSRRMDPRAVELYLRAKRELRRFWSEHIQTASELLEQASAFAPSSPQILSAYAYATVQASIRRATVTAHEKAVAAVERALATGHGEAFIASSNLKLSIGDLIGGATDLGTALARAPMAAQAHENAGRMVAEVGSIADGRSYLESAIGLDPGRAQVVNLDLARLDALDRNWVSADRRIDLLLADPDLPIVQLGWITAARLALWRRNLPQMDRAVEQLAPRLGNDSVDMTAAYVRWTRTGELDEASWDRMRVQLTDKTRPRRFQLITLQRMVELAIIMDKRAHAVVATRTAVDMGLMDLNWMLRCPLMIEIADEPGMAELTAQVTERAAQVLAAFRAASS